MKFYIFSLSFVFASLAWCDSAGSNFPKRGVPAGCDPSVMSEAYWKIWNENEQRKIEADIEANRKTDGVFALPARPGTRVEVDQTDHEFRFGAHIFNFNQLGRT